MYIRYGSLGEPTNENPKKQSKTISKSLKKLWKASFVVSTLVLSSKNMSSENFGASVSIWIPEIRRKKKKIVRYSDDKVEQHWRKKQWNENRGKINYDKRQ